MKKSTIKKIIENGGATLTKQGKKVNYKKGYQVSKKDCFILNIENVELICEKVNELLQKINKNDFVGLWVDNGKIYIDISIKFNILENALQFGKLNKQLSIFDWKNQTCIFLED